MIVSNNFRTSGALPKHWDTMTAKDKESYKSAMSRVREFFDNKMEESFAAEEEVDEVVIEEPQTTYPSTEESDESEESEDRVED